MARQATKSILPTIALIAVVIIIILAVYVIVQAKPIDEVKTEENIGKTVKVRGEVKTVIKIGSLSGYTLEDETGTIAVSSDNLPAEGSTQTVKGTLIRDTLFGYYIKTP